MEVFPAIDPIPLPAPVWVFKALHAVTLALHFAAVQCMVGGLILATWWYLRGRPGYAPDRMNASGVIVHRLPILMAYVINLGVPPLLFAQVLYGRALYTSSILMGVWWVSVVFLVMAAYFILYQMAKRADMGRAYHWLSMIAIVLLLKVGYLYSANMTLMLRPEVWPEMYRQNPLGFQLPKGDPTVMPRWLYMMIGSLGVSGAMVMLLGMKRRIPADAASFMRRRGGRLLGIFALVQIPLAWRVYSSQPEAVRTALRGNTFYLFCGGLLILSALAVAALGFQAAQQEHRRSWGWCGLCAGAVLVNLLLMTVYRDGIRDLTLKLNGFDVWQSPVNTNWGVVAVFLLLFVVMVAVMGWMISVAARAKGVDEQYA